MAKKTTRNVRFTKTGYQVSARDILSGENAKKLLHDMKDFRTTPDKPPPPEQVRAEQG